MSGPLEGIRVIDLSVHVLGPVATQILGDMGADVIKVEPPSGDPMRQVGPARNPGMAGFFLNMNRNKRSVVFDLRSAAAREALHRLLETADVFVHNMRAKAAQRLGISYAALGPRYPKLIYASAPGFAQEGPYADRPAYDDVIQGLSGIADMNRRAGGEARYVPMAVADKTVGYCLASAIGMALFHRERSGEGQEVQVPMFETMAAYNLIDHLHGATFEPKMGGIGYDRMFTAHRRPFPTKDGYICVMAHTDDQWMRLFSAIGLDGLRTDPRFGSLAQRALNIDVLYGLVREAMLGHGTAEWRQRLDAADLPNGPATQLDDLPDDPHLRATGFFRHIDHESEGRLTTLSVATRFSRSTPEYRRDAPRLGQHTGEVLAAIGYGSSELAALDRG